MRTATRLASIALCAFVLLHAGRAWAPYHVVVVDQVFFGTADCPNAQYVMMRLTGAGMVFISNQSVSTQNADGNDAGDFGTFTETLENGALGAHFIMGTADAAALFGIEMDKEADGQLVFQDGRVCFAVFNGAPVDCVAYGAYTGDNGSGGTPATAPTLGMALVRQSDTSNDATDFALGAPAPSNNAGDVGVIGQCQGTGDTPTPTGGETTPTPTPTGVPTGTVSFCVGDCSGEGMVQINELVIGVNIALGSLPIGDCPAFDCQNNGTVPINCLIQAVNNALNGCPAVATPTRTPGGALGVRRFSLDPEQSEFIAVIGPNFPVATTGFEGFLEMTAGPPTNGLAFIDLTDTSDYLAINIPIGGTAVCLKILRDQLPIQNAGIISCNGGIPMGIAVTQDHNLGVVGACSGGTSAGAGCTSDTDCPEGVCYSAALCAAAGGTVEGPTRPHPNTCNGAFVGVPDTEVSGPGTVVLAPVPGFITGIPVELGLEASTPCGDEGITGMPVQIGFTSGHSVSKILNFNNEAGAMLEGEIAGVPFSCDAWADEDGPGSLVLSATNLDTQISPGMLADVVAQFRFVD